MKKLALAAFFVMAFVGFANAHNGALNLYVDAHGATNDCDMAIGISQTDSIYLYYVRGTGYDLGNAVEFACVLSNEDASFTPDPMFRPGYIAIWTGSDGDLAGGVSLVWGSSCLGTAQPVVYLGRIAVFYGGFTSPVPQFTAKIVADPGEPDGTIDIVRCDPPDWTIQAVVGGTFIFNGTCSPGVASKSWGAIRSQFK